MKKIKSIIKEAIITEFFNPKLSQRLSYVIEELEDIKQTAINIEGISKREIDVVQLTNAIDLLKKINRHIGRLG